MAIIFMLSGQGSQYYQMGQDLYQQDPIFRQHLTAINGVITEVIGQSIVDIVYDSGKKLSEPFKEPSISSLSIYLIELALIKTLNDRGLHADILLGSSFGTIVSSVVAGCMSEEEAVFYVANHGKVFKETCTEGCMVAVLNSVQNYYGSTELQRVADLAGVNFESSFVLSFRAENFPVVESLLKKLNLVYQKMPVSRAYHSHWIDQAKQQFFELYKSLGSRLPTIPIACTAQPNYLKEINAQIFWNAIREPMRFQDTIRWVEHEEPHQYIDIGPTGTLANFIKYSLPDDSRSVAYPILTPFMQASRNFDKILSEVVSLRSVI